MRLENFVLLSPFQHIQLFIRLITLENLTFARHFHLRYNASLAILYFGEPRKEEIKHREIVEDILDILDLQRARNSIVGVFYYGLWELKSSEI